MLFSNFFHLMILDFELRLCVCTRKMFKIHLKQCKNLWKEVLTENHLWLLKSDSGCNFTYVPKEWMENLQKDALFSNGLNNSIYLNMVSKIPTSKYQQLKSSKLINPKLNQLLQKHKSSRFYHHFKILQKHYPSYLNNSR